MTVLTNTKEIQNKKGRDTEVIRGFKRIGREVYLLHNFFYNDEKLGYFHDGRLEDDETLESYIEAKHSALSDLDN